MIEKYLKGLEVKKDELTAIERSKLLSEGKEADRIMCCLDTGETLAPMIGATLKEYYHSSEKMCELEDIFTRPFTRMEREYPVHFAEWQEAMGATVKYYDYNIAQLDKPAISLDDAEHAKLVDIEKDGRLPIILKGVQLVKKKLGDKVPVSATVTGPFTIAAMTVGTEALLIGTVKKPDNVRRLMEIIVENNNRYISRLLELGVGIGFADPVSSTSLISVKQYKEFSLPYFQKNVDYIKSHGGGCGLHICGHQPEVVGQLPRYRHRCVCAG